MWIAKNIFIINIKNISMKGEYDIEIYKDAWHWQRLYLC